MADMREVNGKKALSALFGLGVIFVSVIMLFRAFQIVPAGHVGVGARFGKVLPDEYEPGLNFKNPLVTVELFDVRLREVKESMAVPTKEGMTASLDVSVLYRITPAKADEILMKLGAEAVNEKGEEVYAYEITVVEPYTRNIVRDVIAGFGSEDLYNPNREKIAAEIHTRLTRELEERGIVLEDVLLRDVRLPAQVVGAIEQKIKMKQESEQMEFVLAKERQDADRRKVEAEGIATAQKTISGSITPEYLQWKYITALENIEKGPNKTVVIIPFDQKLVPTLQLDGK